MITNEEIRQALVAGSHEMALEAVEGCYKSLDVAMNMIEAHATEAELAADKRYNMLCSLFELMKSMMEGPHEDDSEASICNAYQSSAPSAPRNRRSHGTQPQQDPGRARRFAAVCRILQVLPGYKLHPSGLAIESVGDLSCLSREKTQEYYSLMSKDFLVQSPIKDI